MEELKINKIDTGDSQKLFSQKVNQNFERISESFGGPSGLNGGDGIPGKIGPTGYRGINGPRGKRGNEWTFSAIAPSTGGSESIEGDFWVNVSKRNEVSKLLDGQWIPQGLDLKSTSQFIRIPEVNGSFFKDAIVQSSKNPFQETLSFHGKTATPSTLNPQYSRVFIEDSGEKSFIEFYKTRATGGIDGSGVSPIFTYSYNESLNKSDYDFKLEIPRGGLEIYFKKGISLVSNSGDINLISKISNFELSTGSFSIDSKNKLTLEDQDTVKKPISFSSVNFSFGTGASSDYGEMNSPIEVTRNDILGLNTGSVLSSGYLEQDKNFMVENFCSSGGGNLFLNVDGSYGAGDIWVEKYINENNNEEEILRLTRRGELRILREYGRFSESTSEFNSTISYFGGLFSFNPGGIFIHSEIPPGITAANFPWNGEETILINSQSPTISNPTLIFLDGVGLSGSSITNSSRGIEIEVCLNENFTSGAGSVGVRTDPNYNFPKDPNFIESFVGPSSIDIGPRPYSIKMFYVEHSESMGSKYTVFYETSSTGPAEYTSSGKLV